MFTFFSNKRSGSCSHFDPNGTQHFDILNKNFVNTDSLHSPASESHSATCLFNRSRSVSKVKTMNLICGVLIITITTISAIYNYTLFGLNFQWMEAVLHEGEGFVRPVHLVGLGFPSDAIVDLPVFVSLASVSFRVKLLGDTLKSILHGIIVPTHIFVFISKEPYLLDDGIQIIPQDVLAYVATGKVSIVYTDNIGPHRKLLPLLQRFYNRNVIIVTVDDDLMYRENSALLYQLLHAYNQSDGNQVVALRSRRIGLCRQALEKNRDNCTNAATLFSDYSKWRVHYTFGSSEMLILPTGTGGVLYRPRFFHSVVFDPDFRRITGTADDLMFRLACMIKGTKVLIGCRDLEHKGRIVRSCPVDPSFAPRIENQTSNSTAHHSRLSMGLETGPPEVATQHLLRRNLRVSLYKLNSAGRNDNQWRAAVTFLEKSFLLNMSRMIQQYAPERGKDCFVSVATRPKDTCSMSSCSIEEKIGVKRLIPASMRGL